MKQLVQELRKMTGAGLSDCLEALNKANGDLQKAFDFVKVKGLQIVSGQEGKLTSEGVVGILNTANPNSVQTMVKVNCQTDFVAKCKEFNDFVSFVLNTMDKAYRAGETFSLSMVEEERTKLVASTKENVVVSNWWIEECLDKNTNVFSYVHSNNKLGVLLTLKASTDVCNSTEFVELGNSLAMQVAAMNPLAVSSDRLDSGLVARQTAIFETQLKELNKPEVAWPKILAGKFNKWYTEVCLLNQESVVMPKRTVEQQIQNVENKLNTKIDVVFFTRCQVNG
jgi:elongation factor Ts